MNIADGVDSVFDLIRIQVKSTRLQTFRLAAGIVLVSAAGLVGVAGIGTFAYGIYRGLADATGPPMAAVIVGLSMLAVAGGLAWYGRRTASS